MGDANESKRAGTLRLILVPVLVSVAVTLVRLAGELAGWSPNWFARTSGGVMPSGVSWILGITWLPVVFGPYFALKLAARGRGPRSAGRALLFAAVGVALFLVFFLVVLPRVGPSLGMQSTLILIWTVGVAAGALQFLGWRELAKTLSAYGLLSRAVVVLVMLLAMLGRWGTHYDYGQEPSVAGLPLATKFFWLGFFPQLVFWVGFTVMLGALAGSVAYAVAGRRRAADPARAAA